ncbi:hypothetical protein D3C80_2137290 [compost metagenome]
MHSAIIGCAAKPKKSATFSPTAAPTARDGAKMSPGIPEKYVTTVARKRVIGARHGRPTSDTMICEVIP